MMNLKDCRRLANLSQSRMARMTGIARTKLSAVENGDVDLEPEELMRVERVLRQELAMRAREIGGLLA
jgi:transcriptional regulator with XRE-family HTH domain